MRLPLNEPRVVTVALGVLLCWTPCQPSAADLVEPTGNFEPTGRGQESDAYSYVEHSVRRRDTPITSSESEPTRETPTVPSPSAELEPPKTKPFKTPSKVTKRTKIVRPHKKSTDALDSERIVPAGSTKIAPTEGTRSEGAEPQGYTSDKPAEETTAAFVADGDSGDGGETRKQAAPIGSMTEVIASALPSSSTPTVASLGPDLSSTITVPRAKDSTTPEDEGGSAPRMAVEVPMTASPPPGPLAPRGLPIPFSTSDPPAAPTPLASSVPSVPSASPPVPAQPDGGRSLATPQSSPPVPTAPSAAITSGPTDAPQLTLNAEELNNDLSYREETEGARQSSSAPTQLDAQSTSDDIPSAEESDSRNTDSTLTTRNLPASVFTSMKENMAKERRAHAEKMKSVKEIQRAKSDRFKTVSYGVTEPVEPAKVTEKPVPRRRTFYEGEQFSDEEELSQRRKAGSVNKGREEEEYMGETDSDEEERSAVKSRSKTSSEPEPQEQEGPSNDEEADSTQDDEEYEEEGGASAESSVEESQAEGEHKPEPALGKRKKWRKEKTENGSEAKSDLSGRSLLEQRSDPGNSRRQLQGSNCAAAASTGCPLSAPPACPGSHNCFTTVSPCKASCRLVQAVASVAQQPKTERVGPIFKAPMMWQRPLAALRQTPYPGNNSYFQNVTRGGYLHRRPIMGLPIPPGAFYTPPPPRPFLQVPRINYSIPYPVGYWKAPAAVPPPSYVYGGVNRTYGLGFRPALPGFKQPQQAGQQIVNVSYAPDRPPMNVSKFGRPLPVQPAQSIGVQEAAGSNVRISAGDKVVAPSCRSLCQPVHIFVYHFYPNATATAPFIPSNKYSNYKDTDCYKMYVDKLARTQPPGFPDASVSKMYDQVPLLYLNDVIYGTRGNYSPNLLREIQHASVPYGHNWKAVNYLDRYGMKMAGPQDSVYNCRLVYVKK